MHNQIVFEKLEDYDKSVEKALAGFLTGKKLEDLQSKEIDAARRLIQKLPNWNDQLELSFALDQEDAEAINNIIQKVSESQQPAVSFFPVDPTLNEDISNKWIAEGFNYALHCENMQVRDSLLDWLENNRIKFQLIDEYKICVECDDRETIYKIGKAVTRLNRKNQTVRDSQYPESNIGESKEKIKIVLPPSKPINPMAGVLNNPLFHPKTEKSRQEKAKKKDHWDRKAKHKLRIYENNKHNNQKVLEMNDLPEIKRLRTLAGIRTESDSPLASGPVNTDMELPASKSSITNIPTINTAATDLQATMDPIMVDPIASEPENATDTTGTTDIPKPLNSSPLLSSPVTSEQYARASDMLDQILALVADLKMSEYRMFSSRVNSFVDSVKQVGRAMVSESRKQK
jgi:stalled ribosome alternative rescue factor ArfA